MKSNLTKFDKDKFYDNIDFIDNFEDISIISFENLCILVDTEPQIIVNMTKKILKENQSITTIISSISRYSSSKKDSDFGQKLDKIALFWENCELLRLAAYCVNGRCQFSHLENKEAILKNFKFAGLTSNKINRIREIRNAKNHKFTVKGIYLIDNLNREVATFDEIDEILEVINDIVTWYLTFLLLSFYSYPSLFLAVFFALKDEIFSNKIEYVEYVMTIRNLFNFGMEQIDKKIEENKTVENKLPLLSIWIANTWKFLKKPLLEIKKYFIEKAFGKIISNAFKISLTREQVFQLINLFQERITELSKEMLLLSTKLDNKDRVSMRIMAIQMYKEAKKPVNSKSELNERLINLIGKKINNKT